MQFVPGREVRFKFPCKVRYRVRCEVLYYKSPCADDNVRRLLSVRKDADGQSHLDANRTCIRCSIGGDHEHLIHKLHSLFLSEGFFQNHLHKRIQAASVRSTFTFRPVVPGAVRKAATRRPAVSISGDLKIFIQNLMATS